MTVKLLGNRSVQVILVFLIIISILYYLQTFLQCTPNNSKIITIELVKETPQDRSSTTDPPVIEPEILYPIRTLYEEGLIDVDPFLCTNPYGNITLLIMVTSSVNNSQARMDIRLTWGHWTMRNDVKLVFMLGETTDVQSEVEKEKNQYHDIIQGHFIDSYNNLTLKTVFMLEWLSINCPNVAFVLKTDEDMFINVPKLLDYLSTKDPMERTFYGKLASKWKPFRNPKSKYYVSLNMYKDSVFPDMFSGTAYTFPGYLAEEMFQASLNQTFFKLEDVFLTGIVAKELGIGHTHYANFYNSEFSVLHACKLRDVISVHKVTGQRQYEAWSKVNDISVKCK